jgi:hypothetical protein
MGLTATEALSYGEERTRLKDVFVQRRRIWGWVGFLVIFGGCGLIVLYYLMWALGIEPIPMSLWRSWSATVAKLSLAAVGIASMLLYVKYDSKVNELMFNPRR